MKIVNLFYYFVGVILILFLISKHVESDEKIAVEFDSEYITKQNAYRGIENEIITVNFNISYTIKLNITKIELKCKLDDTFVADFVNWTIMKLDVKTNKSMLKSIGILVVLRHLGQSNLLCGLIDPRDNVKLIEIYKFIVRRLPDITELIFRICVTCFLVFVTFVMGCGLDRVVILNYIKRPVAPGIGFTCQYFLMPIISFSLASITRINNDFALGLLIIGCSPGGGASNIWSVLLHGDLNLSMVMTFLSTVAALFMMPFWLFILARFFIDPKYVKIPYLNIIFNLLQIVLPVGLGMLFRYKFEAKSDWIANKVKCVGLLFIIFIFTFGTYANLYIYGLIGQYLYLLPIGAGLPWLGFTFGALISFLTKRNFSQIITIALETGFQNIGIAILILKFSIPQPAGDIGTTMPLIVGIFTPIPLYITLIVLTIYRKCFKKESINKETNEETNKNIDENDVNTTNPLQSNIIYNRDTKDTDDSNLNKPKENLKPNVSEYFRKYTAIS